MTLGAYYEASGLRVGAVARGSTTIRYESFLSVGVVDERMPMRVRGGLLKSWSRLELAFEVERVFWEYSTFRENGVDAKPKLESDNLRYTHPHLGFSYPMGVLPGLRYGGGVFSVDTFGVEGDYLRQWLLTGGVYLAGVTGKKRNRFQVGAALVSGYLPALIDGRGRERASRGERIYLTFEFAY